MLDTHSIFFKHIFPSPESFFGVLALSKWLKSERERYTRRGELLCYCAYCPLKTIDRGDERQYSNLLFFIFKERTHSARGVLFLSWSVDAGELCTYSDVSRATLFFYNWPRVCMCMLWLLENVYNFIWGHSTHTDGPRAFWNRRVFLLWPRRNAQVEWIKII